MEIHTTKEKLQIAIQALKDIRNPIEMMKNNLTSHEQLNGYYAIKLSEDSNYLKSLAEKALISIGEINE